MTLGQGGEPQSGPAAGAVHVGPQVAPVREDVPGVSDGHGGGGAVVQTPVAATAPPPSGTTTGQAGVGPHWSTEAVPGAGTATGQIVGPGEQIPSDPADWPVGHGGSDGQVPPAPSEAGVEHVGVGVAVGVVVPVGVVVSDGVGAGSACGGVGVTLVGAVVGPLVPTDGPALVGSVAGPAGAPVLELSDPPLDGDPAPGGVSPPPADSAGGGESAAEVVVPLPAGGWAVVVSVVVVDPAEVSVPGVAEPSVEAAGTTWSPPRPGWAEPVVAGPAGPPSPVVAPAPTQSSSTPRKTIGTAARRGHDLKRPAARWPVIRAPPRVRPATRPTSTRPWVGQNT
ncbi:conserved hypothetical protein [Frankia sp. AgKG'84/4]